MGDLLIRKIINLKSPPAVEQGEIFSNVDLL